MLTGEFIFLLFLHVWNLNIVSIVMCFFIDCREDNYSTVLEMDLVGEGAEVTQADADAPPVLPPSYATNKTICITEASVPIVNVEESSSSILIKKQLETLEAQREAAVAQKALAVALREAAVSQKEAWEAMKCHYTQLQK